MKLVKWVKDLVKTEDIDPMELGILPQAVQAPHTHAEYEEKYRIAKVRPEKLNELRGLCAKIQAHRDQYDKVQDATGVPWYIVACIHSLEGGLKFSTHLHNGDSLIARTVRVPAGRPRKGSPPFAWYESAIDALGGPGAHSKDKWTLGYSLDFLERYNGIGYRRRGMPSPYLWSYTDQYSKGKYVKDGVFDPKAVSKQAGAAAILKVLEFDELILP